MVPVLLPVGGVDDEQELVFVEAVEVGVVDRAARLGGDEGVLRLVQVQGRGVVAQRPLKKGQCPGAADDEAPHVRHVEQTRVTSGGQMLLHRAGGVGEGHVPAREVDHLAAQGDVAGVEGGLE